MNTRTALRHTHTMARELWADIRTAPVAAAVVALLAAAAARTLAAATEAVVTSMNPWAAVDAAIVATVATVVGWLAAAACVACSGSIMAFLSWLIPRKLYGVTIRLGGKPPIRRGLPVAVILWATAAGTLVLSDALTLFTFTVLTVTLALATARVRRQQRLVRQLRHTLGTAVSGDPKKPMHGWRIRDVTWTTNRNGKATLKQAAVFYPDTMRAAEPARRQAVERAIGWALRATPDTQYAITWLAKTPAVHIAAEPYLPASVPDRTWPNNLPGTVVGVCAPAHADATVTTTRPDGSTETLPVRLWEPSAERDLLIVGVKGSGKTVLQRGLIVRWAQAHPGQHIWILDGKFGADYAALEGRLGIAAVARTPEQWRTTLDKLTAQMRQRYEQNFAYEAGTGPPPNYDEQLIVIDEIQSVRNELGTEADVFVGTLARMARAAKMRLIVATQRPDVKDAIPGAIKDQLGPVLKSVVMPDLA